MYRTFVCSLLAAACFSLPMLAQAPKTDSHGDALPEGALARLGTVRWRADGPIVLAAMLDAQSAVTVTESNRAQVWDLATGTELRHFDIGSADDGPGMRISRGSMRSVVATRNGRRIACVRWRPRRNAHTSQTRA
jgi:hypothetical protein